MEIMSQGRKDLMYTMIGEATRKVGGEREHCGPPRDLELPKDDQDSRKSLLV